MIFIKKFSKKTKSDAAKNETNIDAFFCADTDELIN